MSVESKKLVCHIRVISITIIIIIVPGEKAIQEVVSEARRVADSLQGPRREELLALCDDVESLSHQLREMNRRGMVSTHCHVTGFSLTCQTSL